VSSPLAIAGVTALLRNLLDDGLVQASVSGSTGTRVTVTAVPPDTIAVDPANVQTQLNLFLHQVTPNASWRNAALPSRDGRGARLTNPPLALDLHYLLTAYGSAELHAEIVLGYAMHVLHEAPVLDRAAVRAALAGATVDGAILPPAFQALSAADLADQVEQLRITPETLGSEEMSRLWSALQARYRPTAAYQVSVVLIESRLAARSALPVLSRGETIDGPPRRERGVVAGASLLPPYPALEAVEPPPGQLSARLGEPLTLRGHHLDGADLTVRFEHPRLAAPAQISVGANTDPTRVAVTLPAGGAAAWPAGAWGVSVSLRRPGEPGPRTTNTLPLVLAPTLDLDPAHTTVTRDPTTHAVTVHAAFAPDVRPGQRVSLAVGDREAVAAVTAQAGALDFVFPVLEAGDPWVRLRVDGADSLLVDRSVSPPRFDPTQKLTVPS
jgi:hypothetical protein